MAIGIELVQCGQRNNGLERRPVITHGCRGDPRPRLLKGHIVELSIQDSGPGIAPELYNAVFERFFRVPGSDVQGSGLGLAIVRRLAEALGSAVQLGPGLEGRGLSVALSLRSGGG